MMHEILIYCKEKGINNLLVDFFDTIVRRNCSSTEVKILWSKKLTHDLNYAIKENELTYLRKKSEQAVIARSETGEFNYLELCREIYNRIVAIDMFFAEEYSEMGFYQKAHRAEVLAELECQSYNEDILNLIDEAHRRGMRISVVSDFYLGQDELQIFLQKDEVYKKIDYFFVSSDIRESKHLGGLYEYVCSKLNVAPSQCVMVGDNTISDIQNAQIKGIKAFRVESNEERIQKKELIKKIDQISRNNVSGALGYSNYCFLLFLFAERLYRSLLKEGIQDVFFLSREGEFLKRLFDLYIEKCSESQIHTHYLFVSRKATYPATLKPLNIERFAQLRRYPFLSLYDFLQNIGMTSSVDELHLNYDEINKPVKGFFNSSVFKSLCKRRDFQELYEASRLHYQDLFRRYCTQEGVQSNNKVAIVDVGWNGTMQDNMCKALEEFNCVGLYVGLTNSAKISSDIKKCGLIFSQNPLDSRDMDLWQYDHVFLERILWASHGATDHYNEHDGVVVPVLKEYESESNNFERIKPVQDAIVQKFILISDCLNNSCYTAESLYTTFLEKHIRNIFLINRSQLELQKIMIKGQVQNFGRIVTAGDSLGQVFSKSNIIKKAWRNIHLLKNTETVFRILLNYDQKTAIRILYLYRYIKLKRGLCNGSSN